MKIVNLKLVCFLSKNLCALVNKFLTKDHLCCPESLTLKLCLHLKELAQFIS